MVRYSSGFAPASHRRRHDDEPSIAEELRAFLSQCPVLGWRFRRGRGRAAASSVVQLSARQLRRNMSMRRLLSFPHLLVLLWLVAFLWGERWVFASKVGQCHWDEWENWPRGSRPHHVALVADPQLIDPHSYPGRPWPLNPLTVLVTDNYLRRSYNQLVAKLQPDTIFFLGDLFDGGREWKTAHGEFLDPEWSRRPEAERKLLGKWNRKYAEDFWLREYGRFGDIFLAPWKAACHGRGGGKQNSGLRGRKLVASLPGNHDLGFGSEIKMAVRDRFEAYFGEGNRVDVVGNHTFVSVDTVSLSANTSPHRHAAGVEAIYQPTERFLADVKRTKRKAVARELRFQRGEIEEVRLPHRIEDLDEGTTADVSDMPQPDPGEGRADLPSVLLTHVPLHRPPGTPCGPLREHWPPAKPAPGQDGPVVPDHRNAISVSGGYQYQNVLEEEDSVNIVQKIGHVIHAFSGDDHDYCELRHDARYDGVPEITVKSISMAMGVQTPGFVLVSLYNPIDSEGAPLPGAPPITLQTRLCLLPSQLRTFARYGAFALVSVLLLVLRAFLVPSLNLTPFALGPSSAPSLPSSPLRARASATEHVGAAGVGAGASASLPLLPTHSAKANGYYGRSNGSSGFSAVVASSPLSRDRSQTGILHGGSHVRHLSPGAPGPNGRAAHAAGKTRRSSLSKTANAGGRWLSNDGRVRTPPKIEIGAEGYDDVGDGDDSYYDGGKWKVAARGHGRVSFAAVVWQELWTTTWRVVWMVVCIWGWLAWKG